MSSNRTFTMIKPGAVKHGYIGPIIEKITSAGFRIVAMKMTQITRVDAKAFYEVHKSRPFYNDLVDFIISGPIVAMILEKEDAVAEFRKFIGATDPHEALQGTIRSLYATSKGENAIHGSDSDENAMLESAFFFSRREMY